MTQHSSTLHMVRKRRRIARRQRPYSMRRSKLEVHRASIIALHAEGASLGDIQYYLRSLANPSMSVERSTIMRFLVSINADAPS